MSGKIGQYKKGTKLECTMSISSSLLTEGRIYPVVYQMCYGKDRLCIVCNDGTVGMNFASEFKVVGTSIYLGGE